MKRRILSAGLASAIMSSGLTLEAQVNKINHQVNIEKATEANVSKKRYSEENKKDLPPERFKGSFGMTPKEYGIRFGNGKSRIKKQNMLKVSRNAGFSKV